MPALAELTQEAFSDLGPSEDTEKIYTEFDQTISFLDDAYLNRANNYVEESENYLNDYQILFLMKEFNSLVKQVMETRRVGAHS